MVTQHYKEHEKYSLHDTFSMFLKYMVKREIPVVIIIPQIPKRSFTVNSIICVYSLCYLRS